MIEVISFSNTALLINVGDSEIPHHGLGSVLNAIEAKGYRLITVMTEQKSGQTLYRVVVRKEEAIDSTDVRGKLDPINKLAPDEGDRHMQCNEPHCECHRLSPS